MKISNKFRWGICLLSLLVVIYLFLKGFSHEVMVVKVKKGSIRDSVTGNVRILAEQAFDLRSETQGRVLKSILFPFGKPVEINKGQILFELDDRDLNRSLRQALFAQDSHLKRLKVGSILASQVKIEEKEFAATSAIHKENGISNFEFEKKEKNLEYLQKNLEFERISFDESSKSFEIEIERLMKELEKKKITSPISGILVSSSLKPGDMAFGGHIVGKLISRERIVQVSLNEEDFVGLQEKQKAGVTLFAFGKTVFEGTVDRLAGTIDPTTGRRNIFVNLNTKMDLPVGASGRAEIIKNEIEQTVIIPRRALLGDVVLVVDKNTVEIVKVKVGAKNLEKVQIIEGLEIGDQIICETPHLFYQDQRVNPQLTSW
tara:strand:+ start:3546 stop:4667 length:1122 start_codon:yes stop_codon:yes gene_type:complete